MLDVDKWYSEKWNRMTSAPFSKILEKTNKWLTDNNYQPLEETEAKALMRRGVYWDLQEPYCRLFDVIEKAVQSGKLYWEDVFDTGIKFLYYVPKDHGAKAGEEDYGLSRSTNVRTHPNDYGVDLQKWNQKTKH